MANYTNLTLSNGTWVGSILPGSAQMVALQMIPIQRINRVACCSLGFPLNIFILVVIARSRQLWSPRNIFWLGVTFANFLVIAQSLGELVTNVLYQRQDESHLLMCQIHSTLLGCPFGLLLTSLTMASLDRYLALSRPQFYNNQVTIRRATIVLVGAFVLVAGFHTAPYWTRYYTPKCGIRYNWLVITMIYQGILSLALVVIQILLFVFLHNYSSNDLEPPLENIEMELINGQHQSIGENDEGKNHRINRVELRSARILNLGILPFSFVTLTTIISAFLSVILNLKGMDESWARFVLLSSRELVLVHLVYVPFVFITQSREFCFAAKRFYRSKDSTQLVDNFN